MAFKCHKKFKDLLVFVHYVFLKYVISEFKKTTLKKRPKHCHMGTINFRKDVFQVLHVKTNKNPGQRLAHPDYPRK